MTANEIINTILTYISIGIWSINVVLWVYIALHWKDIKSRFKDEKE